MPCRINRARLWVGRMQLEALEHPFSCFVTLTYNEEHLPSDGSISKREVQLFLKRLRQILWPRQFRYYAVGEYGEKSWRPHYHLVLFGVSPTEEDIIDKSWQRGFIQVGTAQGASMQYVCGYITKRMTNKKDLRLQSRLPEFSLMSRKPGIGYGSVERMAAAYSTTQGKEVLKRHGWIITKMQAEGKTYPLGRYLQTKLIKTLGLTPAQAGEFRYREMRKKDGERPITKTARVEQRKSQVAAQSGKYSITRGRKL